MDAKHQLELRGENKNRTMRKAVTRLAAVVPAAHQLCPLAQL